MKFERRKLADLRPAEYNPRKKLTPEDKEYQDIKRSILEFGYADPIVINFDGTIIKGHQRRTVMMDLGYEDAEVIVLDIQDKTKEKALNTALNKITGKWDNQMLKDLLVELDLEGYDFSVTGFQRTDLEDLIQLTEVPPEAQEDDFDPDAAAEAIDVPVSRAGNIWRGEARPGDHRPALHRGLRRKAGVPRSLSGAGREPEKQYHRKRPHGHRQLLQFPAGSIPELQ